MASLPVSSCSRVGGLATELVALPRSCPAWGLLLWENYPASPKPAIDAGGQSLTGGYNYLDRTNVAVLEHAGRGIATETYRGTPVWIYATTCAFGAATGY